MTATITISQPVRSEYPIYVIAPDANIEINADLHSDGFMLFVAKKIAVTGSIELRSTRSNIRFVADRIHLDERVQLVSDHQKGTDFFLDFKRYALPSWREGLRMSPNLGRAIFPLVVRVQEISSESEGRTQSSERSSPLIQRQLPSSPRPPAR